MDPNVSAQTIRQDEPVFRGSDSDYSVYDGNNDDDCCSGDDCCDCDSDCDSGDAGDAAVSSCC